MKNVEEKLDVLTLMELEDEFRNSGINFSSEEYILSSKAQFKIV